MKVPRGVRVYEHSDGKFTVADHAGWVEGVFSTRDDAVQAATPCTPECGCGEAQDA